MVLIMKRRIYINGAEQISIQKPLCEEWIDDPISYNVKYTRSIEPDFKAFLSPIEARRMGKILKRALVTSLSVLRKCGIEKPEAIITGTGLGCIENTELFLDSLCRNGESLLKPTYFMQSTHNTISSLLAIHTKSHGYNVTYAHKGISYDSALFDAYLQLGLGKINNALVGGHDEMTPSYFNLLEKIDYVGGNMQGVCGEAAVSTILSCDKNNSLCELLGIRIIYKPTPHKLRVLLEQMLIECELDFSDIDAIMTGINGNIANDNVYMEYTNALPAQIPLLKYKHLFGECYTSSGFAIYTAAHCLHKNKFPGHMVYRNNISTKADKVILLMNHSDGKNFSLTLLRSICGN